MPSINVPITAPGVLVTDKKRRGISFINNGVNTVYLRWDGVRKVTIGPVGDPDAGMPLGPGEFYDVSDEIKNTASGHPVFAIAETGAVDLRFMLR